LPGVKAALEMYVQLVQQSHWAVAIGTGLVFEGEGPKRMGEERQALEARYPWIPSESLAFFRAHEYHDEGHGNFIVDVIKDHIMVGGLQEEMRAAVRTRVDIMWLQNESIYQAFVRPQLSPEAAGQLEAASS
jgi:pyrroloquinoline quinone (PQQ) biosynthesis protein C